jgi:tetratricopeptide (TPR) repeat protein
MKKKILTILALAILALVGSAQCQQMTEDWHNNSNYLDNQSKYEEAIKDHNETIKPYPNLTEDWFVKGKALLSQYEEYDAIEAFRRFLEIDPKNATGWNYLGESLYAFTSDPMTRNEAIQAFDKSIELDPQNAAAWCNKGIVLRDNASHWRDKLFDQYSADDLPSSINQSHIDGMYDEAIEAFNRSIEIDPKNAITWLELGTAFAGQGKPDEAEKAYNESLKIEPRPAKIWIHVGERFASQGQYEEAVKAFDKAIDLDPLSMAAWSGLRDALMDMNAYDEAYHIEPIFGSGKIHARSERTEAAYLDHENRNKRYLALDNPSGHISESVSFEGWRADFDVNQKNYTIKDLSDLYSGTIVALNGQETSIYNTIIRITSPDGVGNLKLAVMPVDQEELFLSDPISMAPWHNKYEIKCRQEDNGTVALAMTIYSGYKSDPFENIRLTNTSGGYHWDTVR